MEYELKQYGCDKCGALTPVMDPDESLPEGWVMISKHSHLCPNCAKTRTGESKTISQEEKHPSDRKEALDMLNQIIANSQ